MEQHRQRLIWMPGCCPELHCDELPNPDVKTNDPGKSCPTHRSELMGGVRRHLYRRQKQPPVIRSFFQEQPVRYAA